MEDKSKLTDGLLDSIREELNLIVNESASTSKAAKASKEALEAKVLAAAQPSGKELDLDERLASTEIARKLTVLDNQGQSIDEELQKMLMNLQQSYELFTSIGEKMESVNFSRLRTRIRDLNLHERKNLANEELKKMFYESLSQNDLTNMIQHMGSKFTQHPGEFGDIPELGEFFQACSQLQSGLQKINLQREETALLSDRMQKATASTYDRISGMKKLMEEESTKRNTRLQDSNIVLNQKIREMNKLINAKKTASTKAAKRTSNIEKNAAETNKTTTKPKTLKKNDN